MFGWLRRKKKPKSLNIKISATQISDAKRRDMDAALEWLNELLDNDGFEDSGRRSRDDSAAIVKLVSEKDRYELSCEIYLDIIVDQRESNFVEYVSGVELGCDLHFSDYWETDIEIEESIGEASLKKCRSTYEKFMQKVEKTGLLGPAPDPE